MIIKVYMEKPQVTTNCLLSVRLIRFSWQRISFLHLKIIFFFAFFLIKLKMFYPINALWLLRAKGL